MMSRAFALRPTESSSFAKATRIVPVPFWCSLDRSKRSRAWLPTITIFPGGGVCNGAKEVIAGRAETASSRGAWQIDNGQNVVDHPISDERGATPREPSIANSVL